VDTSIPNDPTTDASSVGPYIDVSHKISARMVAGATVRYNYFTYNGGQFKNDSQNYYSAQLNLDYKISQFLTATASYMHDTTASASAALAGRDNNRNRIFLGLTAHY
jgi:Putative beta-barrel porin 2